MLVALVARSSLGPPRGHIDVAWSAAGERECVLFREARACDFFERARSFLRLAFSYHDEAELDEGVRRMAQALKQASPGHHRVLSRGAATPMPTDEATAASLRF